MLSLVAVILENLLVPLASFFLKRRALSEQGAEDYLTFLEIMSRSGLATIEQRRKGITQMNKVRMMWDKERQDGISGAGQTQH